MKKSHFKVHVCLAILTCALLFSCSKDDSSPEPDTTANPIENPDPDPDPDPNPDPDPDPDPDPVSQADIPQVDNSVLAFMQNYDVPGAALAVSVNGKLVYSKGFGMSNVENQTMTNADDVFRLASISKTFTSAAIMKLIDNGQLNLEDKVFGSDGILGDNFGSATLTNDERNITVNHLLFNECGGWGVSSGGDPIDFAPNLNSSEFIEYVLNNWTLSNAPGEAYSYSNTGYWLLARIIESVSGETYEDYLRNLLAPAGITSFKTTSFREDDREPNEVEYYGTPEDAQFIYTIASRRDGDGGVVISAPDLLRFLNAIDGFASRPDIISSEAHSLISESSAYQVNWGRGIGVWEQQNLLFMTGSLPGTRTWSMVGDNGINAAILFNYRRTDTQQFDFDIQDLLLNMVNNGSIPWQTDLDQF